MVDSQDNQQAGETQQGQPQAGETQQGQAHAVDQKSDTQAEPTAEDKSGSPTAEKVGKLRDQLGTIADNKSIRLEINKIPDEN